MTTTYAAEIVPVVLRSYLTAWLSLCWGIGILLSSGILRALVGLEGELGYRLPFALQWIWPLPLAIAGFLAPESPWNAVRRNKFDLAKKFLLRLSSSNEQEAEATLAYIRHTTELERVETANASYIACFKGTNLRRTEIVSVAYTNFVDPY